MKRRRNSDDNLRKLERKAFATQERSDILAYWAACLRAGEIPKPTFAEAKEYKEEAKVYTARPKEYFQKALIKYYTPRLVHYPKLYYYQNMVWSNSTGSDLRTGIQELLDWELAQPELTNWELRQEKRRRELGENPRRRRTKRNPDDDIRKLERNAASGEADDIANYWKACIRARVKPNYTLTYTENPFSTVDTEYWTRYQTWTLYPKIYRRHREVLLPSVYIQVRPNLYPTPESPEKTISSYPILVKRLQRYEWGPYHNEQLLCLTDKDFFEALQSLIDLHDSGYQPIKRKAKP